MPETEVKKSRSSEISELNNVKTLEAVIENDFLRCSGDMGAKVKSLTVICMPKEGIMDAHVKVRIGFTYPQMESKDYKALWTAPIEDFADNESAYKRYVGVQNSIRRDRYTIKLTFNPEERIFEFG